MLELSEKLIPMELTSGLTNGFTPVKIMTTMDSKSSNGTMRRLVSPLFTTLHLPSPHHATSRSLSSTPQECLINLSLEDSALIHSPNTARFTTSVAHTADKVTSLEELAIRNLLRTTTRSMLNLETLTTLTTR
jgi:hypothetical protein